MTFALRPHVTLTSTDRGTVLFDLRHGRYFQLNASGALIVRSLLGGATPRRAAELLSERYGVPADRTAADVSALLATLAEKKLATT
ncbi:lasso peptide biosynthesis PqqD family chaperone [Streptomyces litchfieldiae]|uniref:Lasso peptide biosynthesis PqqD family chaperone n=1 Tax=Streptomyces litchfieldiae TaxID=3075543 RepID=A0ABU2MQ99_9ACTN|nr:lasso peptide biosynthesis PqqD family chaperone [Streptomyces sp. DSM 44938]MDT0343789.1 lasso peptide biosynthesis PqqD family chaperone [Streptomyces sp. DSM 44938]